MSPRGLRRGQVNFRAHNSRLSLEAPSPGRRGACVLFGVSFRGGYSPTGLPGDTVWLALPPTGWGGLSVLSQGRQARRRRARAERAARPAARATSPLTPVASPAAKRGGGKGGKAGSKAGGAGGKAGGAGGIDRRRGRQRPTARTVCLAARSATAGGAGDLPCGASDNGRRRGRFALRRGRFVLRLCTGAGRVSTQVPA